LCGDVFHGNPALFKAQWAQVADAVHAAGGKMMFSPNVEYGPGTEIDKFFPDPKTIDVLGLDYYPKSGSVASAEQGATDALAKLQKMATDRGMHVPIVFGEIAITGSAGDKQSFINWLQSDALKKAVPDYGGFRWFDFNKGGADFRITTNHIAAGEYTKPDPRNG
jgi:hypothetical protein